MEGISNVDSSGFTANATSTETTTETVSTTSTVSTTTTKTTTLNNTFETEYKALVGQDSGSDNTKQTSGRCLSDGHQEANPAETPSCRHGHHGHHKGRWAWLNNWGWGIVTQIPDLKNLQYSAYPKKETPAQPVEQPKPAAEPKPSQPTKQINIGTKMKFTKDFLWKPVSDKDGNLAIILPERLTGKVTGVKIVSKDQSKRVGKGKYSGIGNGNREHFRFKRPGSAFPKGSIVVITLDGGKVIHVPIKHTDRRVQK